MIIIQKTQKAFDNIVKDVLNNNLKVSKSFKVKLEFIGNTNYSGNKDVEIVVPLKYLNTFWRTLEMSLINCEIGLTLAWSANCAVPTSTGSAAFEITDTKF